MKMILPAHSTHAAPPPARPTRAFTLIELLVVMGIIGVLLAAALPALTGLTGASSLSTGTRQISNTITLARTEAIARNTITRVAIASSWPKDESLNYRKISIWAWDREAAALGDPWVIISDWETLPGGVTFETGAPAYLENAAYAVDDLTTTRVDHCLDSERESPVFETVLPDESVVTMEYFEFRANGAARLTGGTERTIALVLTEGFRAPGTESIVYTSQAAGLPLNWAQINTSNLTGRIRIYRP